MQPSSSMNDFSKSGFARLLKFFENTDDIVKLTRAFGLATKAHMGQLVNKSEPYINHPLRVALILTEELQIHDVELVCAALLHDAHGSATEQDLMQEHGERVHSIVHASAESKAKPEEYFAALAKAPKDVRYIKVAERLDDVRAMKGQAFKEKVTRYKEETQKYVVPIASATDDKLAFKLSVALYELK
jgi:(p)ppGpp synthase/HD superfamily hydrolase